MSTSPTIDQADIYKGRAERLRHSLRRQNLDTALVTNPENRRYLTGFTGHDSGADSAGSLIVTGSKLTLITDARYLEQAEHECSGLTIQRRDGAFAPLAAGLLRSTGAVRIGFEATHLTVSLYEDLLQQLVGQGRADGGQEVAPAPGPSPELVSTRNLVEQQRVIKDGAELQAIERAVAITDETFTYLCTFLKPGLSERQVAQEIERYMLELGADGLAFNSIVASGPNSALPHAIPGDRVIGMGEPITIDMGARYDGYCSDMTRTVCLGEPGQELQTLYDLVLLAQETCERGLGPGLNGQQVDALARDVFRSEGREEQYLHSTGHGLGLEIHEDPRLSKFGVESLLEPGMVVTIEPGLYIASVGGVRIEDTAVITESGIRILTSSHKRLQLP
jgi:Xaa-Pro aminopeptidase